MGLINAIKNIFQRNGGAEDVMTAPAPVPVMYPVESSKDSDADPISDPTGWLLDSGLAEVILMNTHEIKLMCMFGYALLNGYKLYPKLPANCAASYRFISLILANTGGGIVSPLSSIPCVSSLWGSDSCLLTCCCEYFKFGHLSRMVLSWFPSLSMQFQFP